MKPCRVRGDIVQLSAECDGCGSLYYSYESLEMWVGGGVEVSLNLFSTRQNMS